MKRMIASSLILLGCTSAALSEEVLREISWAKLKDAGQLSCGELLPGQPPAPSEQLKIENWENMRRIFTLFVLDDPGITSSRYAITGRVRCEGVRGKGYLEMCNRFPDGSQYCTRSMGQYPGSFAPKQDLEGSCTWRPFSLLFDVAPRTDLPESLVVNVVLPGRGTVYLGPLRLVQYAESENPLTMAGAWWDDRTGGVVGGILGTVLGCLGALIGTLGGTGKARRFVLGLMKAIFVFGLLLLATGAVALVYSQPHAVWYPLLLTGILSSAIFGGLIPVMRRRYEQVELRRMSAMDAAVGVAP